MVSNKRRFSYALLVTALLLSLGGMFSATAEAALSDSQPYMRDGNSNYGKVVKNYRFARPGPAGSLLPFSMNVRRVDKGQYNIDGRWVWRTNIVPLKGSGGSRYSVQYRMRDYRNSAYKAWTGWRGLSPDFSDRMFHKVRPNAYESRAIQFRVLEWNALGAQVASKVMGTGWMNGS